MILPSLCFSALIVISPESGSWVKMTDINEASSCYPELRPDKNWGKTCSNIANLITWDTKRLSFLLQILFSQVWELQFMNNKQVVMTLMHLRWLFTGAVLFSASLMNVLIFRRKINLYDPGVWEWGYGISGRKWMTLRSRFMIFPCCVRCPPDLPFSFHRHNVFWVKGMFDIKQ